MMKRNLSLGCINKHYKHSLVLAFFLGTFVPVILITRSQSNGFKVDWNTVSQSKQPRPAHTNVSMFTPTESAVISKPATQVGAHDIMPLMQLLGDTWHTEFIRKRIQDNWKWRQVAYKQILDEGLLGNNRSRKTVLVYPGVIQFTHFAKDAFKGAPLGELVQWSDLIWGLHLLGHTLLFEWESRKAKRRLTIGLWKSSQEELLKKTGCLKSDVDIIYTDLIGHSQLSSDIREAYKYRFRILDVFGTEQAYNNPMYAKNRQLMDESEAYGLRDLNLKQFYTLIGHTRDNSFLGFVVKDPDLSKFNILEKKNISLIYGKDDRFQTDKVDLVAPILQKYTEVHTTLPQVYTKWNFTNHGVLKSGEYLELTKKSKLVVGIGKPLEGPGILEAIANGCILINPRLEVKLDTKPTNRTITSQNVYCEKSIGPPHVFTLDYRNSTLLEDTIRKALAVPVMPFLPHEMTAGGFILRLNLYIENQTLCDHKPAWPSVSMMQVYTGYNSFSCDQVCDMKDLQCENTFFKHINNVAIFAQQGINCNTIMYVDDLFVPAFVPLNSTCLLQKNSHLFSCASYLAIEPNIQRLCPCRSYTSFGTHICKWC